MFTLTKSEFKVLEKIHVLGTKVVLKITSILNESLVRKILIDKDVLRSEIAKQTNALPVDVVENWLRQIWVLYGRTIFTGRKKMFFDPNRLLIFLTPSSFPVCFENFVFELPSRPFDFVSFSVPGRYVEIGFGGVVETEPLEIVSDPDEKQPQNEALMPENQTITVGSEG